MTGFIGHLARAAVLPAELHSPWAACYALIEPWCDKRLVEQSLLLYETGNQIIYS